MGKSSSISRDMTQFAGRGGTGLVSSSRVSRVLRSIDSEEYEELMGKELEDKHTAMLCNVAKFTDGSPLFNKPFLIERIGYLFERHDVKSKKTRTDENKMADSFRIFEYVKDCRSKGKYPNKTLISAFFQQTSEKIPQGRVKGGLEMLTFTGLGDRKLTATKPINPTETENVFIVTDHEGKEM